MEQILVVVYWCDLPQFELFCYSLNRFWKSNRSIKIIISTKVHKDICKNVTRVNAKRILNKVKNITKTHLCNWNCQIKIGEKNLLAAGWSEQQIYKVFESANTSYTSIKETVVFDCKDIFLTDLTVNNFKNKNNHYLIKTIPNAKQYNQERNINFSPLEYWSSNTNTLPLNLTPWIWNNRDVHRFMRELERRDKENLLDMEFFPGNFEIETFFIFVKEVSRLPRSHYVSDDNKQEKIKMMFVPTNSTVDIRSLSDINILKIHRTNFDQKFLADNSVKILYHYDFPKSLIENWKIKHREYLENWKNHNDLEIKLYRDIKK